MLAYKKVNAEDLVKPLTQDHAMGYAQNRSVSGRTLSKELGESYHDFEGSERYILSDGFHVVRPVWGAAPEELSIEDYFNRAQDAFQDVRGEALDQVEAMGFSGHELNAQAWRQTSIKVIAAYRKLVMPNRSLVERAEDIAQFLNRGVDKRMLVAFFIEDILSETPRVGEQWKLIKTVRALGLNVPKPEEQPKRETRKNSSNVTKVQSDRTINRTKKNFVQAQGAKTEVAQASSVQKATKNKKRYYGAPKASTKKA